MEKRRSTQLASDERDSGLMEERDIGSIDERDSGPVVNSRETKIQTENLKVKMINSFLYFDKLIKNKLRFL